MKSRVLKLAKRLGNFTLEDIEPILNCDNLGNILSKLVAEKSLEFNNIRYFYIKKTTSNKELPNFFKHHTPDEIEMIIKCFCADIPALKTTLLIDPSKTVVSNFYKYFRELIYESQLLILKNNFVLNPKSSAIRTIYNKKIYLHFYEGQVLVIDKILKTKTTINKHSELEMREIRNSYYKVRRHFQNFSYQKVLPEVVAERLWRENKKFDELVCDIKSLLG